MNQAQQDYQWVQRSIDSCTNTWHIQCIDTMIDLYNQKHENFNLYSCLIDQRNARLTNIEIF